MTKQNAELSTSEPPSSQSSRGENMIRCWNIYFIEDPGYNDKNYRLLRKKMRTCQFRTVGFGKGFTMIEDQLLCMGYKLADHDSYNCPFSQLPGWLEYKPYGPGTIASATDFADEWDQHVHTGGMRGGMREMYRGGAGAYRSRGRGRMSRGSSWM